MFSQFYSLILREKFDKADQTAEIDEYLFPFLNKCVKKSNPGSNVTPVLIFSFLQKHFLLF